MTCLPRALALGALAALLSCRHGAEPRSFGVYWWYRDPPAPAERELLRAMGVTHLFVLHAEIGRREDGTLAVVAVCPLREDPAYAVVPVVRIDHEVSDRVGTLANWPEIEEAIARAAEDAPNRELQIDFDCPEAALARYGELLRGLKARRGSPVSTVALLSWLDGEGLERLSGVSSVALLAYGGRAPVEPGDPFDVGSVGLLARHLGLARRSGIPFFIGLPTYGEAWVFRHGQRAGYVPGFDLDGLTEDPGFAVESAPAPAESAVSRSVTFRARVEKLLGNVLLDPGDRVTVAYPDRQHLAGAMETLSRAAGASFQGFVLHRASRGEAGGLTLSEARLLRGGTRLPFALHARYDAGLLTIEIDAPERSVLLDALALRVTSDRPGTLHLVDGNFDHATYLGPLPEGLGPSTPRRATDLRLSEAYVGAGETVTARIEVAPGTALSLQGTLGLPDGERHLAALAVPAGASERAFR